MTTTAMIRKVLARDEHACVIRGPFCTVHATCADHRAGRGAGGSKLLDDMANLIAACELCNWWKEDVTGPERERLAFRGVRVFKRATNADTLLLARAIPVLYPDGLRRVLNSDGTREVVPEATAMETLAVFGIRKVA